MNFLLWLVLNMRLLCVFFCFGCVCFLGLIFMLCLVWLLRVSIVVSKVLKLLRMMMCMMMMSMIRSLMMMCCVFLFIWGVNVWWVLFVCVSVWWCCVWCWVRSVMFCMRIGLCVWKLNFGVILWWIWKSWILCLMGVSLSSSCVLCIRNWLWWMSGRCGRWVFCCMIWLVCMKIR